jgi:hypothetical protein
VTACVVPAPFDMRPDFWTNGLECDPEEHHASFPELGCDDDSDCDAGEACQLGFDHTYCADPDPSAEECRAGITLVCADAGDCPPCATACEPWAEFPQVSRCVYDGGP